MRKFSLIVAVMGFLFQINAQENVLSSGAEAESTSGKVTFSVGLIHYKEATGTGGSTSVGPNIPFEASVLSIDEQDSISFKLFPNPINDFLNVHLSSVDTLKYQVIDLSGREVTSGELNTLQSKIELTTLESSIYIFNILKDNLIIKSFKILKK